MSQGNGRIELLNFSASPERVVSLVPSMTESLYELGAGEAVIGVTEYCPPPPQGLGPPALVGGTKSVDTEAVIRLEPDLVIANQEENTQSVVEALDDAGLKVWVTFPKTVEDVIQLLNTLIRLFRLSEALPRIRPLEQMVEWSERLVSERRLRTFVPVWYQESSAHGEWWMTFNEDTYAHDVLHHCNARNVFAERARRYPLAADLGEDEPEPAGERDTRYPRVLAEEIIETDPEVILLPSEPFVFEERHKQVVRERFGATSAVGAGRVHLVDGSLITWHGTRLARALTELPPLFEAQAPTPGSDSEGEPSSA